MSDEANRIGQVSATPEGGPIDAGAPAEEPGTGQVRVTPEAGPLSEGEELRPPTWREHMSDPIPGLDQSPSSGSSIAERQSMPSGEPRPRPAYIGKPVSEVRWDAIKYAAPVVSQAEKLLIKTIDLSARGLSWLAGTLEERRQQRERTEGRPKG